MSRQIIKGDELQLFLGSSAPKFATAHSVTITGNTLDRNTKDDGFWGSSSIGKITWELTAECLYTDGDYDAMFDMMIRREKFMLRFARVKNYDANGLVAVGGHVNAWQPDVKGKQGYATITSITANANTGENATYSVTFTGAGPLSNYDNLITDYAIQVKYNTESIADGMQLFNTRASQYINSGWVFQEGHINDKVQIDISDGTLHDATPNENTVFLFYLSGNLIPSYMFYNVSTISDVFIPSNIIEIDDNAFDSSSIVNVRLDGQMNMKYGNNAFQNCTSLTSVGAASGGSAATKTSYLGAKTIGTSAFEGCVNLGNVNVGDGCRSIGRYAFSDCMTMSAIHLGSNTVIVGDYAISSSTMPLPKDIDFYTKTAPYCSKHSFGDIGYQHFFLHNASTVESFLSGTDMERYYPQKQCEYTIWVIHT